MLAQLSIVGGPQPLSSRLIWTLGMTPEHIPNYEPAFLDALKSEYHFEFLDAAEWFEMNEETISAAEKTMLEGLLEVGGAGSE